MKSQLDYLKLAEAQAILNSTIHHTHQYHSVYSTWKFQHHELLKKYPKNLQK